jgi:hypothetical protein
VELRINVSSSGNTICHFYSTLRNSVEEPREVSKKKNSHLLVMVYFEAKTNGVSFIAPSV